MSSRERRYGRGKFEAHARYIEYMEQIARNPAYKGMPNAVSADGHVNWQVSSGKGTSFYKYYVERSEWWVREADKLKLPGTGNQNERFSVAARMIHPTGYRPCRLCGELKNVGYFYLNVGLAGRWNLIARSKAFEQGQAVDTALEALEDSLGEAEFGKEISNVFPERSSFFEKYGVTGLAFEKSNYVRSGRLSPGFMCNPPDRLDGFHDYGLCCRQKRDPGRSEDNLRSYAHDRRTFEWWAEGDWKVADALYNAASAGQCSICGKKVDRVSPDHVGPLACGFKQIPLFVPTCQQCNSAKNRRLSLSDVKALVEYEGVCGASVASWQVRAHWDANKSLVANDAQAKELSAFMRALQDFYLRTLHALLQAGRARFLVSILNPDAAYEDIEFRGLDTSTLTFKSFTKTTRNTPNRKSLAARSVRIAFDELIFYVGKSEVNRKLAKHNFEENATAVNEVLAAAAAVNLPEVDGEWDRAARGSMALADREELIAALLENRATIATADDVGLRSLLQQMFDDVGSVELFRTAASLREESPR